MMSNTTMVSSSNKNEHASFDDLKDDTLNELLTYSTLAELNSLRQTSPSLLTACNHRKRQIHKFLQTKGTLVQITNLNSAKGKEINGRLASIVDGKRNADPNSGSYGRYAVKLFHLTGESEVLGLKPQNLNPFLTPEQQTKETSRLNFINYTSDGKIREGHGRLLDQIWMMLRYSVNRMEGFSVFPGEFDEFFQLPRSDERVAALNAQIFTLYKIKPSEVGMYGANLENWSILEMTIASMAMNLECTFGLGEMARYHKDGPGGRWILRNMALFMQCWDTERVHGEFWIAKIAPNGTLMVQRGKREDGEVELGKVYLVKGIGSQVGEDIPSHMLPMVVRATFVPVYDFLVYDGVLVGLPPLYEFTKEEILSHVDKAVREQSVIYCGDSAARGLWDGPAPEVSDRFFQLPSEPEEESSEGGETSLFQPTKHQIEMAKDIINLAERNGFPDVESGESLTFRRLGYTLDSNPHHCVGVRWSDSPDLSIEIFQFEQWPSYSMDEMLTQFFNALKNKHSVPIRLMLDELSLVKPCRELFKVADKSGKFCSKVKIEWYPPPSEEEQAFYGS